ncbi:MAG: 2-hydroxyacyl-CoA dehydratase [Deltaproteobacteria bacterium]|nr:2-hydroxyacyl-CoA dehydratase [Deltaproteobacteria bacterium]
MTDEAIRSYLASHRGNGVVLALPVLYPREVLTALDLCGVEVWAHRTPPGCCTQGAGSMQPYLCPTVRGARVLLGQGFEGAIAAVIPHTCDSMQGLAAIGLDMGASAMPVVTFRHPRGGDRASAREFLQAELRAFIASIERIAGRKLTMDRLGDAIELHEGIDRAMRRVLRMRTCIALGDVELYRILRKREWMRASDFAFELRALEQMIDSAATPRKGIPLMVSGMVPEPSDFFEAVDAAGAYVAVDDYAAIGRRLPMHDTQEAEPIGRLIDRMMGAAPCPTRTSDPWSRVRYLVERARAARAPGAILHTVKFCEPELFDVPVLRRGLEEAGLKVLHIETEFEPQMSGQLVTRIEAFVEMLGGGDA